MKTNTSKKSPPTSRKKVVKAWIDIASGGQPYRVGLVADFNPGQLIIYAQKNRPGLIPCTITYQLPIKKK